MVDETANGTAEKLSSLAARLNQALQQQEAAAKVARVEAVARQKHLGAMRDEMLEQLAGFGKEVDSFKVSRAKGALTLGSMPAGTRGQKLTFAPVGIQGEVEVTGSELDRVYRIFREERLERWVLVDKADVSRKSGRLLFDQGLIQLMGEAFNLSI
jgi:hypothetical protein